MHEFHLRLEFVPKVQINSISACSDNGLALTRRQATIWTNDGWWLVHWCIYASLGLNELIILPVFDIFEMVTN